MLWRFAAEDTVVLDAFAAASRDFAHFEPRRSEFSLPAPYQAASERPQDALETAASDAEDAALQATAARAAAAPAAERAEADASTAAAAQQQQQRKRQRRSKYEPNVREQQAAARHAQYAPALAAAASVVQRWLAGSGAATVQEVMGMAGPPDDQHGWMQQRDSQQAQAGSRAELDAAANGAGDAAAAAEQEEGMEGGQPEYLALLEMRHVLKPKLQFAAAAAQAAADDSQAARGGCASATAVAAAAAAGQDGRQQDVQQPAWNLFNRLTSSEEGLAGDGGSAAGDCRSSSTGGSSSSEQKERLAYAAGHAILVPPRCRWLMSDARQLQPLLDDAAAAGGYHCILLDPPWENKSAKRSARYPTLPSRHLLGLPVRQLMHEDGCLVCLWVTNRERHYRFIESELLLAWGLAHLTTWHWLKITDGGQPVGRLDIEHRRPYESLLLCWPAHLPPPGPLADTVAGTAQTRSSGSWGDDSSCGGFHLLPGRQMVVAAVPPAAHSRKPHLGPLLAPLLPSRPRCLEMFARELHSGWTSWGNEVLKFQSLQRFERRPPEGAA